MKRIFVAFTLLMAFLTGCSSDGMDGLTGSYKVGGAIQKGPFIQGSSITIQPLNNKLNPTGQMFTTQTTNDAGLFSIEGVSSKYAEIIATGYYFDEVEGGVSTGPLTLRSVADLKDGGQSNVNLLTTLIFQRVQNLVKNEKMSIPEATAKAERELFQALGIPEDKIPDVRCERMNISEGGEHNGLLLAISVVLQHNRSVGDLSELIAKMSSDLANDGQLEANLMNKLILSTDPDQLVALVTNNLVSRYNDLGVSGVVPPFAEFINRFQDFDGDGTIDSSSFAILECADMQIEAAATEFNLPFLYVDMEACEISISDNTPEAKEWVTLTIDGDNCFVAVEANTTESERSCEIIIKERGGDQFVTFTIIQNPSYKVEYTYDPATSTGELLLNCNSNVIHSTHSNGEGVIYFDGPISCIGSAAGDITSISLPSSVERIEMEAFYNCPNLVEFRGPLASEDGLLLISNGVLLVAVPGVTECVIPDSVTSIGEWAFCKCYSLTSVTIPDSVTSIGNYAFSGCTSLPSITIPDSITSIAKGVFCGCESFESITIPDSVTSIGDSAFYYCISLTSVTIGKGVTVIENSAFSDCPLTSVYIADIAAWCGISFGFSANPLSFANNLYLNGELVTDLVVPEGVTSIGSRAFAGYTSLTSITIPDSVTEIATSAFENCTNLTCVNLEHTTPPMLGDKVFDGVENLVINIPEEAVMAYLNCDWPEEYKQKIAQLQNLSPDNLDPRYIITYTTSDGQKLTTVPNESDVMFHSYSDGIGIIVYSSPVTSIRDRAFENCTSLESITIPDSVTSIGEYAFDRCKSLESITIPEGVTSIGYRALFGCTSLTSVTIPDSVTEIVGSAFRECTSLASVTIGNGVTKIGNYTFWDCTSLESITIPDSVTSIGDSAFIRCTSLESITIPDSVTSIGEYAFEDCKSLESVYVTDIAAWCGISFGNSAANPLSYAADLYLNGELVTDLVIPDGVTSIGYAFKGCTSLESITIPDSVTSIGNYAFWACTSLESITIPDSVTSIGDSAFFGCTSLESITIPDSVTSIGEYAFSGCTSLESITIPDSVTSIGEYAFSGCTSLESITIPDSVTSIGHYAFYDCKSLTSITIPEGVTSIGYRAFSGCTSLESITIPDSVTSIGDRAFSGCTSLTSVTVGNGVTSIGDSAFQDCTSLTSVIIGNGVTSIGGSAFAHCSSLTSITIPNSVTEIGGSAFAHCSSLTSVTIPDSVTEIGYRAFASSSLIIITIGKGVTSIGESAFSGCFSLARVYCRPTTPPKGGFDMFTETNSYLKIYVPSESVETYKTAKRWRDFADQIVGYDFE